MATIWLPIVSPGGPSVPTVPPREPSPKAPVTIPGDPLWIPEEAHKLLDILRAHPQQGRPEMVLHAILVEIARERVEDMLGRDYFSHISPDGVTPNELLDEIGYRNYYPAEGNNIESIAGGYASAEDVFEGFYESEGHRVHLLGLDPFFSGQVNVGIWYEYRDGAAKYDRVWSVISAHPEDF